MSTQTARKKRLKNFISEDYFDLVYAPSKLFHPYRLLIMQALMLHGNVEFRQFRHNIPEVTDGNLASHLRVVEKMEYVRCHKEVVDRKLRTSYEITEKGRKALEQIINSLKKMIKYGADI